MSPEKNKTTIKEEPTPIVLKETKQAPPKRKPSVTFQRDKDREKVKGIFKFYEVPGSELRFNFRAYKGDPIQTYHLVDGQVYTIPLGVAKHLNNNGQYPQHEYLRDESGNVSMRVGKKVRRFGFQSLEFVDVDELATEPTEIVTVEKI